MKFRKKIPAAALCFIIILACCGFPTAGFAEELAVAGAAASSFHPAKPPAAVLDKNTSTYWEIVSSDKAPCLTLDLGAPELFNKISMRVVFPSSVKSFAIVAADSKDMMQGAVVLAEGTQQNTENDYTFPTVRKRYISYRVTSFSGRIGLSEVSVSKISPAAIALLDSVTEIQIPEQGGAAACVRVPAYILRDSGGALIDAALYKAEYAIESAEGVSVEGENIIVTDQAQEAELTLTASLPDAPGITAQSVVRLSRHAVGESDRTYVIVSASASSANGAHVAGNMIDDNPNNRWQALGRDTKPVISFDLGTARKFNKIKINQLYPQNVARYVLEAADSEDMSQGRVTLAEGTASASVEGITFPAVEKRYVRYTFAETNSGIAVMEFKVLYTVPAACGFNDTLEPAAIPKRGEPDAYISLPGITVKDAEDDVLRGDYSLISRVDAAGVRIEDGQLVISSDAKDQTLVIRAELEEDPAIYGELFVQVYSQGFQPNETDKQIPIVSASATTNHGSYPPSNAIDGILTTRWQPLSFDLQPKVTFDLGTAAAFNKIVMVPTAAASVKEFVLEAADDPNMTQNRVVLAAGSDIRNPAVFTFETVKRRYIRYALLKIEGASGILEFSVRYVVPAEIQFREIISDIGVPAGGEGARRIRLPEVVVTDSGGDEIHPGNYSVAYSVSGANGVSLSDGFLIVDETAGEGEFSLEAHVDGREEISAVMPVRTFVKENLLSAAAAEEAGEGALAQLTDNDYSTGVAVGGMKTFLVDAGKTLSFNKFVIMLEEPGEIGEITIFGAQREDFSDEELILTQSGADSEALKLNMPKREARYLKLTVTGGRNARLMEFEAYEVYPSILYPAVTRKTVYIPGFEEGTARTEPAVGVSVLDKYGDPVFAEDAALLWSAPEGLSQGVTLDGLTGKLTIEPTASATSFTLRASSALIGSLHQDIHIDLKEEVAGEVVPDHMAYGKPITSSRLHGSYPAKNAVDGLATTRMQFSGSAPHYLTIDLEEAQTFNSLTVNFMSVSGIIDPTVRASDDANALLDESSVIAVMKSPLRKVTTVSLPTTTARYLMLHIPTATEGCAIMEIEVRNLCHALIVASAPESVAISEETVITDAPVVDVKDGNGVSMVIFPEDYYFEAVSLPRGASLNADGSLTVGAEAEEGVAAIRVISAKDSTVYSQYTIRLVKENAGNEEESQRLVKIADGFRMESYVAGGVAQQDFPLPTELDGAELAYTVLRGGEALSVNENGEAKVTRKTSDVNVRLLVSFRLNGQELAREYDVRVPAKISGGGSGGRGTGGSGGAGGMLPAGGGNTPEKTEKGFPDIGELPWAKPYLQDLINRGILNGSEGLLRPKASVTREEFVKMIVAAFLPNGEKGTVPFTDVPEDSWCRPYVAAAVRVGLIQGISQTEFGAGRAVTREDAAVIAARAAKMVREDLAGGALSFADSGDIADYAKAAVAMLHSMGVVSGTDENQFMPKSEITRAEAAKIIGILMREVQNEEE